MFTYFFDAFIITYNKYKKNKTKSILVNLILVIVLIASVLIWAYYLQDFLKNYSIKSGIFSLIIGLIYLLIIYLTDNFSSKKWKQNLSNYNLLLDDIKLFLDEPSLNGVSWCDKDKIKYLISQGEKIIEKLSNNAEFKSISSFLIPAIAFFAGIILTEVSLETKLIIGIITILLIIIFFVVVKIANILFPFFAPSTSIKKMEYFIQALNDLLIRDFSE